MTKFILENPSIFRGKKVLNFACGSAIESIACLQSGSTLCVNNDIDPLAILAGELNGELNEIPAPSLQSTVKNLIGTDVSEDYDIILAVSNL